MNNFHMFKATFRNLNRATKDSLKNKNVVLLISPDHDYHEGEKLYSIINAINSSNFPKCIVVVGDTNYRHTLSILHEVPETILYQKAKEIGDRWMGRNQRFLNKLKVPYELTRWDLWLNYPTYQKHRNNLDEFYEENIFLKNAFNASAKDFVTRFMDNKTSIVTRETAIKKSVEYLKEECAIIMPMWAELGMNTIIYPNKMLSAMQATYEQIVIPRYGDSLLWLTLRFKRYKQSEEFIQA